MPWEDTNSIRKRQFNGGEKPTEGAEVMGTALTDYRLGGFGPPDIQELLQVGGSCDPPFLAQRPGSCTSGFLRPLEVSTTGCPSRLWECIRGGI